MSEGAPDYRERWVTAQDGLRLYLRDYGSPQAPGTPVLCLGGLVRNSKDYHTLAARLATHRRVLCPDYRGRGLSDYDPDWRHYRAEVYAADILQILFASGVHGVVVCGTSLGGIIAMGLSVLAPTMVSGAILNDIGPEVDLDGMDRILVYVEREQVVDDWDSAVVHVKQLYAQFSLNSEEKWRQFAKATFRRREDGRLHQDWDPAIAHALRRTRNGLPDLWPYFRGLRHLPVLAIRGVLSDILKPETFDRMAEEKPDLIRLAVEGVGHTPALDEEPALPEIERYLDLVDRKLAGARRAAATTGEGTA